MIDAADRVTSARVVERGLKSVGLTRGVLEGPPHFIPYALQAAFAENVARQTGERHLGPLVVSQYGYADLDVYARYVLAAPQLGIAFARGVRALPYLQSGASVSVCDAGTSVVLRFGSGIQSVVGARHIDEGVPLLLIDLVRRFLGADWSPDWVELPGKPPPGHTTLHRLYRVPLRFGQDVPGIAISRQHLTAPNPFPRATTGTTLFRDLRAMVRQRPPRSVAELVRETLQLVTLADDSFEDAVAARLGLGKRTLQRHLAAEGHTFREILASFRSERAGAMLRETDLSVQEIAAALGYLEVNSFRRAFYRWAGMTPTEFSARMRA